jgi:uncharacterized protein YjeT (DUF2065 family)
MVMLRAAGMFLVALGLIWILQGLGWLSWPADSVMLGKRQWSFWGGALVLTGAIVFWLAARRRRD